MTATVQSARPRHRTALPGGRRRAGRLRELLVSGLVDSFGLSLGWTLFNLVAVDRGGLALAALFNAAMLLGVVLSAPVTGWLARHLHGRTLLLLAGGAEAALRVGTLAALLAGFDGRLIAAGVAVMHVAAYAGFAAMRAEVAAADARPRAMTRYALSIAAVEAAGAGVAALLPMRHDALVAVFVVYCLSLAPTMLTARRARVLSAAPPPPAPGAPIVPAPDPATSGLAPTRVPGAPTRVSRAAAPIAGAPAAGPGEDCTPMRAEAMGPREGFDEDGRVGRSEVASLGMGTSSGGVGRAEVLAPGEGTDGDGGLRKSRVGGVGRVARRRAAAGPGGGTGAGGDVGTGGGGDVGGTWGGGEGRPTRVARRRAEIAAREVARGRVRLPLPVLAAGGGVMLLASGPTLLSVALASELHGQAAVAGAAAAFSAGCLLSSPAVDLVGRLRVRAVVAWPLWGVGMLAGWMLAPAHLVGLFFAQFLSGLSMTAFEGGMDARLAQAARPGTVTTILAWSASTRALGSAIAVRTLPLLVAAPAVGLIAGTSAALLATAAVAAFIWTRLRRPNP